jgi:hypothetical protein
LEELEEQLLKAKEQYDSARVNIRAMAVLNKVGLQSPQAMMIVS